MSSADAWAELQELKLKRDSRRRRVEERKKEVEDILTSSPSLTSSPQIKLESPETSSALRSSTGSGSTIIAPDQDNTTSAESTSYEESLLRCLADVTLILPADSKQLQNTVSKDLGKSVSHEQIMNLLQKFAVQQLISIQEKTSDGGLSLEIISSEHTKLLAMVNSTNSSESNSRKRRANDDTSLNEKGDDVSGCSDDKKSKDNDVLSLLSLASTKEKEHKRIGEEILELLSRPTAKEKTLAAKFRSQGGTNVQEFCPHGTKSECRRMTPLNKPCSRLHFRKIIQAHTDESLGDCSFLNTCFHMESCKYVHYEVDSERINTSSTVSVKSNKSDSPEKPIADVASSVTVLHPPQWVHCDLRFFDMTVLGKFSVIMADPPWDIHMELPYGTLSDDEMRHLNIPALQDEGLIFLWVTGRAMELGRECLQLWGYERVDELIWVKTNQLQRIIRTGRTGHWLNHGKEHCLVGMKGNPPINRGLDADIIVAEVRATSHKPDEVYGIIERLSPGTRKIELFGRPHNVQPNWMTLGNQLEGVHLVEEDLKNRYYTRYPDGDCMVKPK